MPAREGFNPLDLYFEGMGIDLALESGASEVDEDLDVIGSGALQVIEEPSLKVLRARLATHFSGMEVNAVFLDEVESVDVLQYLCELMEYPEIKERLQKLSEPYVPPYEHKASSVAYPKNVREDFLAALCACRGDHAQMTGWWSTYVKTQLFGPEDSPYACELKQRFARLNSLILLNPPKELGSVE